MSSISSFTSTSSISDYFSVSLGSSSSSSSSDSSSSILGDYASLRNGSYYKLLKAYYSTTSDTEEDEEATAQNKLVSTDAGQLYTDVTNLMNTDFSEDNRTTVSENVTDFVNSYNDLIESADDSDVSSILQKTVWMTNSTSVNSDLLASVGITVNSDNTLSIDESELAEADMTVLKDLFSGSNSYASKISTKASQIYNLSLNAGTSSTSTSYSSSGEYSTLTTDSIFDSLT